MSRRQQMTLAALRSARRLLKDEYDGIIDAACHFKDGKPDLKTLDHEYIGIERRYRRVLKKIDEAMR